ncbi:uncharacterized protein FIBRA_06509 [Fibroporia radiculosa]|uniref:Uncharacterized protein n=1 Tax=Fibroporia radiculosa TaxID=599839 RepID=J4HZ81_9APHY|nr:uncharacterized protein FIBRA_06509 [Fibroporia radiculosa]CCM04337.1 predicted protein [Fibroporia radiculosa]
MASDIFYTGGLFAARRPRTEAVVEKEEEEEEEEEEDGVGGRPISGIADHWIARRRDERRPAPPPRPPAMLALPTSGGRFESFQAPPRDFAATSARGSRPPPRSYILRARPWMNSDGIFCRRLRGQTRIAPLSPQLRYQILMNALISEFYRLIFTNPRSPPPRHFGPFSAPRDLTANVSRGACNLTLCSGEAPRSSANFAVDKALAKSRSFMLAKHALATQKVVA